MKPSMHDYDEFPVLGAINQKRIEYFDKAHDEANPFVVRVGSWFGHKGIYLLAIPLNAAGLVVGTALTAASTCVVGAIKVVTYMATRGTKQLDFGTGFVYFGEKTVLCGVNLVVITIEIFADIYFVFSQAVWGGKWVLDKLYITSLFFATLRHSGELIRFTSKRVLAGWNNTKSGEEGVVYQGFPLLRRVDHLTQIYRIDHAKNQRPLTDILIHYGFSAANIPLNMIACAVATVAAIVFSTFFILKVAISATTTLDIPIPTAAPYMLKAMFGTARSVAFDLLTDIADIGFLAFKVTEIAGINQLFRKKPVRRAIAAV